MATFFIEQFGCRATQADAAAIERQLRERGYTVSGNAEAADVVVVNTCTVTAAADAQAREAIRGIHRANPAARVIVTGCYAQRAPGELAALAGVSWVVGNSHKPEIPRLVGELAPLTSPEAAAGPAFVSISALAAPGPSSVAVAAQILTGDISARRDFLAAPIGGGEAGRTRPILKIQDGCSKHCSYCVIPSVRGSSRSLGLESVLREIRSLCAAGAREIVLSGIDLGNYGRDLDPRVTLVELLRSILDGTTLERLRLSSVEPMDITEELIAVFSGSRRIARHVHMPLQSGSDRVLKAMHRWYRAEHYARRAELVRERLADAAIGADVIAGFPGETEADHRATLEFIERSPLTYLHVFSFSVRPGTPAASLSGQVPDAVIARRANELRALGEKKKAAFQSSLAGSRIRALTLRRKGQDASGPWTRAVSGNYLDLRVAGDWEANRFLDVRLTGRENGVLGGVAV